MAVRAYLYDAEGDDREVELTGDVLRSIGPQQLLWIDIDERDRTQLKRIAQDLNLDQGSFAHLGCEGVSRVENYGTYAHFSVHTAPTTRANDGEDVRSSSNNNQGSTVLDFVVNQQWLLTIHDGQVNFIEAFRSEDRPETMIGALTPQDFAASLLDAHLETFFEEIGRIEALVDRLDEQALTNPSGKTLLGRMVALRRRVSRLRASLARQRGVFYGLSRPDFQVVSESGAAPHFQVLVSRFERAIDEVEHARDLVVGSFELFASRAAQQTNDLVKVLTYLTAIIGICAAVAGVFGMNFEAAFFETGNAGFYATIISLTVIIVGSTLFARWRGWI